MPEFVVYVEENANYPFRLIHRVSIRVDPRKSVELKLTFSCLSQSPCQYRHAQRHAVLDFLDNNRLRTVGHIPGNFQTSNDRTGMHQQRIIFRQPQPRHRDLVTADVVGQAQLQAGEPLSLHSQRTQP